MKDGEKAILVPGISRLKISGSSAQQCRLRDVLRAMTEEVTILKLHTSSGNSRVKDRVGMVFYCNPNDLTRDNELLEGLLRGAKA